MKFTPEVIAALQTLKDNAENDFERHRIAVLERDLTAPPTVEVIDEKHQKFNGVIYCKNNGGHLVDHEGIHRAVYSYYFGEIPCGYEIHHVDENKTNNDICNLVMLGKIEHQKLHNAMHNVKPPLVRKKFICQNCGKEYESHDNGRNCYCSNKCYEAANQTVSVCQECGKEFSHYKHRKAIYCSKNCQYKAISDQRVERGRDNRKCPVCGKIFECVKSSPKVCCSLSCARQRRNHHQN